MSRPIKFRAWNKEHKKWLKNINPQGNPLTIYTITFDGYVWEKGKDDSFTMGEIALQQFTGITDAKGKEVYEGDIMKYSSTNHEGEVIFWQGRFLISSEKDDAHYDLQITSDLEVIGNIYETPELLTPPPQTQEAHT